MSWLISRALYENLHCLPEPVAASSEENSSGGERSAPSNGSHIPQAYCAPDKMMQFSRLSRFGMTFKPLTADRGEELLMSFREGFPAKTSAPQEKVTDLTGNAQECGSTWRGWSAKFDPDSSLWRIAQCSLLEGEPESLQTLPRSGMTRGGLLWELPMSERRTNATDSGLLPTLTVRGNYNRKGASKTSGDGLATALRKLPTFCARDWKDRASPSEYNRNEPRLAAIFGGPLNPMWCEWFMGFPLGWTELRPLVTDKSHCVLQKHGEN